MEQRKKNEILKDFKEDLMKRFNEFWIKRRQRKELLKKTVGAQEKFEVV